MSGTTTVTPGADWERLTVAATVDPGARGFRIWILLNGEGTVWLDDAELMPVGGEEEVAR